MKEFIIFYRHINRRIIFVQKISVKSAFVLVREKGFWLAATMNKRDKRNGRSLWVSWVLIGWSFMWACRYSGVLRVQWVTRVLYATYAVHTVHAVRQCNTNYVCRNCHSQWRGHAQAVVPQALDLGVETNPEFALWKDRPCWFIVLLDINASRHWGFYLFVIIIFLTQTLVLVCNSSTLHAATIILCTVYLVWPGI